MLEAIETELKRQVGRLDQPRTRLFHEMLSYHMGWVGEGSGPQATGKRIRPLLTLLSLDSVLVKKENSKFEIKWLHAVSAAAAVELVHNFSLVHDDIQDNSELRRGRKTVWVKWGSPMAINVGDAIFVIANQAVMDLQQQYPAKIVNRVSTSLNECCLELTKGQFLDMSYEERKDLKVEDYWPMVGGKTSALLSICTQIGAILGYAQEERIENFRKFGHHLGLAFQVQDDILGIWGDQALTGKSAASDLVEGKNSLPVLFGLEKNGEFSARWKQGPITPEEVQPIALLLEKEGGKAYAEKVSEDETKTALKFLDLANPYGEAGQIIRELANLLLQRNQ
jgi:geranylgeranyl diphosphate synthase type I